MSEKGKKHPAPEEAIASEQPASAAERALREAAERRRASKSTEKSKAHEIGGRKGPEPTRYGDWERKGILSDF